MDTYDYTSSADMKRLAERVRSVPPAAFAKIAPAVMGGGLMRTNWIFQFGVKIVSWRLGVSATRAWTLLAPKIPGMFDTLQEDLAKHVESGRDAFDRRSAAGLCDPEVEILVGLLDAALVTEAR